MTTNKAEIVDLDGYGAISDNNKYAYIFYIVKFMAITYTHQKDIELDGNQITSSDTICNEIYTYTGRPNYPFYVDPEIIKYPVVVLMMTDSIPNIDVKVWTLINEIPQGDYLCSSRHQSVQ